MDKNEHYLGNMYGFHDGYDGSVFLPLGVAKTIVSSVGGIELVMEIYRYDEDKKEWVDWLEEGKVPEVKQLGNLHESERNKNQGRVYDTEGICPTLNCMGGGGLQPHIVEVERMSEQQIVAMRGRYNAEGKIEQNLEPNVEGTSNAITTCEKDNLVLEQKYIADGYYDAYNHRWCDSESSGTIGTHAKDGHSGTFYVAEVDTERMSDIAIPINTETDGTCRTIKKCVLKIRQATKQGYIELPISKFEGGVADLSYPASQLRRGRVQGEGQISPTIATENIPSVIELADPDFYNFLYEYDGYIWLIRIRKLTEYECLRLMDVDSVTAIRMCKAESATQTYKAAGNSIVCNCLTAIFGMMFEGKEEIYKQDRWVDNAMNPPVEDKEE